MKNLQGKMKNISGGENAAPPPENIGSDDFYQGEKKLEEVDAPEFRRGAKVEMVKKEEIYKDKIEKNAAFIASLGRKKEAEESSTNSQPDYVERKTSRRQKMFFAISALLVVGAIVGGGYFWWLKKPVANQTSEKGNTVVIPINPETPVDNSAKEEKVAENKPVAEVAPADMNVKVLNAGAAAGSAGRIKTILVGLGYAKTEAGNGQAENVVGSVVYYKDSQFQKAAEVLGEILITNKIKAEIKEALTAEQKSADVVVILGK